MSREIIPSIIGENFGEIREKLERLTHLVSWAQIDIVDGLFAMPTTWPYKYGDTIVELKELLLQSIFPKIEVHLMVENPETEIERWLASGASRVWFHYESTPQVSELLTHCETSRLAFTRKGNVKICRPRSDVGVVLNLGTPATAIDHLSHPPNFIQTMSIERIGSYGASFSDTVFPKIEYLRRKFPRAKISVDGGVNLGNVSELMAAGADRLVVGSEIWKSRDIRATIKELQNLHGKYAG